MYVLIRFSTDIGRSIVLVLFAGSVMAYQRAESVRVMLDVIQYLRQQPRLKQGYATRSMVVEA